MARIAGVDLPRDKRVDMLPYLYLRYWPNLCPGSDRKTGINPATRVKDLTEDEIGKITGVIDKEYKVEGDQPRLL